MAENPAPEEQISTLDTFLAAGLAGVAGIVRLIDHPYNMTPMNALGLFGGARLPLRWALVIPLAVMVASDLAIWAVKGWKPFNAFVYASFVLSVLLGRLLTRTSSPVKIGAATLLCSLQFFLITNFSVWVGTAFDQVKPPPVGVAFQYDTDSPYIYPMIRYERSARGLMACYAHGITMDQDVREKAPPFGFFGNLVIGDLGYSAFLFGMHAALAWWLRSRAAGQPVPVFRDY